MRSLKITASSEKSSTNHNLEKFLLYVSDSAAQELQLQLASSTQKYADAEILSRLDSDRVRMMLSYRGENRSRGAIPFEYMLRDMISGTPSRELIRVIGALDAAKSEDDILREIKNIASRFREEAEASRVPLRNKIETFAGEETSIPAYVTKLIEHISTMSVLYLRERRKSIGKEEAKRLLDLKVRRGGDEALHNIQDTVAALLGVRIDAFQGEMTPQRGEATAELDVDNFLVQVNGSGIREALRLVLDYEFGHPKILLVEEPEVHLHPALETSMMRYLKRISADCQIFLTTHSTNFLDTADMKNVYLVSKPKSTRIKLMDVNEAEIQIPRELGIRLSSLFMFDRLVFVEGPSDEDVLREWAIKIGVNLSQANVGFIHMNGVRNYANYATDATLTFLTKRQVRMWFLIDRDEKDSEEVARIQAKLKGNAVAKILNKREIENYLIVPRPIVELIKLKKRLSGVKSDDLDMTELEIQKQIAQSAEELKQFAIEKRVAKALCRPVYPSNDKIFDRSTSATITERITNELDSMIGQFNKAKENTELILQEQTELVNRSWEGNKLAVVPGDLLLDAVLKKHGVRFVKERDGARLAALMTEPELDPEIKNILQEIGS